MIFNSVISGGGGGSEPATHTLTIDHSLTCDVYAKSEGGWLHDAHNNHPVTYEAGELIALYYFDSSAQAYLCVNGTCSPFDSSSYKVFGSATTRYYVFAMPDADTSMYATFSGPGN